MSKDSFKTKTTLEVAGKSYEIFDITGFAEAKDLPFSLKILLENLLRTEDGANITADQIKKLAAWDPSVEPDTEINLHQRELSCRILLAYLALWTWPRCVKR